MEELRESDVLWPEEGVRHHRPAYGGAPPQQGCYGSGVHDAGGNNGSGESAPMAIPSSAPAGRHRRSWKLEFARQLQDGDDGHRGEGDDEGEVKEMVPPHVMVARRLSGKMAFSVCTGQGRTLKGRDLSQVRNSILRLTGFLEG